MLTDIAKEQLQLGKPQPSLDRKDSSIKPDAISSRKPKPKPRSDVKIQLYAHIDNIEIALNKEKEVIATFSIAGVRVALELFEYTMKIKVKKMIHERIFIKNSHKIEVNSHFFPGKSFGYSNHESIGQK